MATTYRSYSLVTILDIRGVETTNGERPQPTRWSSPRTIDMLFMARSSHLGQVLLRDRMPPPAPFLDLDAAYASA